MNKIILSALATFIISAFFQLAKAEKITFDEPGISHGVIISNQYDSIGINWVNDPQNMIADSVADFNNPFPADGQILWYTTKPAAGAIQLSYLASSITFLYRRPFAPGTITVELLRSGVSVYSENLYWQSGQWDTFSYTGANGKFNQILMSSTNKFVIDDLEVRNAEEPLPEVVYYRDSDGDGYGTPNITITATAQPEGYVLNGLDCNDSNAVIHPGATKIDGDGIDQDCSGSDLLTPKSYYRDSDGDGYGTPNISISATAQPEGYVLNDLDCNDSNAAIHPGATEIADDGIDQDCSGSDLLTPKSYYRDSDGDGYGNRNLSISATSKPAGYVLNSLDCNDSNAVIHPGATEICGDGTDQNCDGLDTPCTTPKLTKTQVSQLYVTIFGRASEGSGNLYWQTDISSTNMISTANIMLSIEPARAYFGETLNNNLQFIEHIYKNTLGKTYEEDALGINYWVSELNRGKSKGEVVSALIEAAQLPMNAGAAQNRFNNKVAVSDYCADKIINFNDFDLFESFISSITDSQVSVDSVINIIDSLSGNL